MKVYAAIRSKDVYKGLPFNSIVSSSLKEALEEKRYWGSISPPMEIVSAEVSRDSIWETNIKGVYYLRDEVSPNDLELIEE